MVERRPFNPERINNGKPPPERGGIRFNVTARPPERTTTPTIPREAPPPPQQELTAEEITISDELKSRLTPKKPKNIKLIVGSAITAGLALTGIVWGVNKALGDDEPTPQTSSADFPNTPNKVKDFDPSNVVRAKKFDDTPPNRGSPENISSQNTPIDQLPTIKQHTEYAEGGNYDNFDPGINFRIKEQPPVPYTYKNVTPDGLEPHTIMMDQPSFIRINGYVIRKEVSPEGNILLAVEVPGKNGLFNQNDIDKSLLSTETFTDNRHYDKISGAIVWLKIENFEGYSWPFGFSSSWNVASSAKRESNKITNIPGELLKYLRVGDPMNAIAEPELTAWGEEKLVKNYKNRKNHLTYDQAREKYSNMVDGNAATIQRMLEDAKAGGVSLKDQLESKRYVLQVREANFVPRN